MSKEQNTAKPAVKKPPAGPPAAKTPAESVEVKGKVVRKDAGAGGKTAPNTADVIVEKSKKAAAAVKPAAGAGKIVRKDPPAAGSTQALEGATVAFDSPADAEAAAEEFLLGDDAPAENQTVAFMGATVDVQASETAQLEEAPPSADAPGSPEHSRTQAFAGDTLDSEMPKLVADDQPAGGHTQAFTHQTVDSEMPKEPAQRPPTPARKPAGAAQKGSPMASMLGGKYKLLKVLGKGGMGTVYKAHDEKLDRIVAIKVLAKELSGKDNFVQRFLREGRVMVKLDHPNVIRCFDIDKDEAKGLHFLAIEFVEGGSVEGWLKKMGRFSLGDALHIILKAATGLQHAHEKSLIHRDVKPDNLLMTKDGIVKVADLGLAKDTEEDTSLTKTGAGAGTPIYMAPEQARDVKHVDCKVDIYALGVMLYVFLTGQPPFQGNTLVELISAKEKGKFDPMRKHNDEVPTKLDLIVDKMMAKDPKNRYASCQDVINELGSLGLHNETLSFIEVEGEPATEAKKPASKVAPTKAPSPLAAQTSVGAKGPSARTSAPASVGDTAVPTDEDVRDVWFWQFQAENGRPVTKKLTTEQVRTLIKAGHLDNEARLSKSEKAGFRGAGTYTEFQSIFKSLRAATKANSRASSRGKMSDIVAEDERRRKYGWFSRLFKGMGSTLFGLLWITLILAIVGGGGYALWHFYLRTM